MRFAITLFFTYLNTVFFKQLKYAHFAHFSKMEYIFFEILKIFTVLKFKLCYYHAILRLQDRKIHDKNVFAMFFHHTYF